MVESLIPLKLATEEEVEKMRQNKARRNDFKSPDWPLDRIKAYTTEELRKLSVAVTVLRKAAADDGIRLNRRDGAGNLSAGMMRKFGVMKHYKGLNANGTGVINVVGRFNIGTFIVSLGAVPSPIVFSAPPAVLANSTTGAVTNGPVQIYPLGIWFNSPADALNAGCPGTATTFTSNHDAGIQVLNTATFPDNEGPLFHVP